MEPISRVQEKSVCVLRRSCALTVKMIPHDMFSVIIVIILNTPTVKLVHLVNVPSQFL